MNFNILKAVPLTPKQNWHHLYSSSVGGKDLSNDTQIRVIGSLEAEICPKILRNLSEKLGAKFSAFTLSHSKVKIVHLNDVSLEIFELEASPVEC